MIQELRALLRAEEGFRPSGYGRKRLVPLPSRPGWDVDPTSRIHCTHGSRLGRVRAEEHSEVAELHGRLDELAVGRGSYAGRVVIGGIHGRLRIGRFCSIGTDVMLLCGDGYHRPGRASTYPFPFKAPFAGMSAEELYPASSFQPSGIDVGHDVWVGHGVTITKGVKVGDGAVLGTGSVVTADVPAYAIAAGNPASVRRLRHDEETVGLLLAIKWWDWPYDEIRSRIGLFRLEGEELKRELSRIHGE